MGVDHRRILQRVGVESVERGGLLHCDIACEAGGKVKGGGFEQTATAISTPILYGGQAPSSRLVTASNMACWSSESYMEEEVWIPLSKATLIMDIMEWSQGTGIDGLIHAASVRACPHGMML